MRILLTGATGFIGRNFIQRYASEHHITAVSRRPLAAELGHGRVVVVDLGDPSFPDHLPKDVDVVVHLAQAYLTFPDHAAEIFAINAASTQRLADWATHHGVRRFVLASSGSVYAPSPRPILETDPAQPLSFHPATKLFAEQLLGYYERELDVVRLRLFAPYGPGQRDRMIPRLIEAVADGRPVQLSRGGEPRLNPIHVDDVVSIIGQAIAGAGAPVVNVAGPRALSVAEIAEIIGAILRREPLFEPRDIDPAGDLIADTGLMHEVFRVESLVDPDDGLSRMTNVVATHA